jgi:hypothetical protein
MPEISRFLGIVIRMFYRDHAPPHFHAEYGDYEVTVGIETGVVEGRFPKRALKAVLEWLDINVMTCLRIGTWRDSNSPLTRSNHWSNMKRILRVIAVRYLGGHRLYLEFNNGHAGELDLSADLDGQIFQPLRDTGFFATVRLEGGTVSWPNGADIAPGYLAKRLAGQNLISHT